MAVPPSVTVVVPVLDDAEHLRACLAAVAVGSCDLELVDGPPWDALAHRVDRVIRARDVLVLRRPQ